MILSWTSPRTGHVIQHAQQRSALIPTLDCTLPKSLKGIAFVMHPSAARCSTPGLLRTLSTCSSCNHFQGRQVFQHKAHCRSGHPRRHLLRHSPLEACKWALGAISHGTHFGFVRRLPNSRWAYSRPFMLIEIREATHSKDQCSQVVKFILTCERRSFCGNEGAVPYRRIYSCKLKVHKTHKNSLHISWQVRQNEQPSQKCRE